MMIRMVNIFFKTLCFLAAIAFFSGCAVNPVLLKQAQDTVGQAQRYFEAVKDLKVKESYPQKYEQAEKTYTLAESYLKKQKVKQAIPVAKDSVKTSKDILTQYYRNEILPQADRLKKAIVEKVGEDTDNPLNDQIPDLEDILKRSENLDNLRGIAFLEKVIEGAKKVIIAGDSVKSLISKELKSDVSFDTGKYELAESGVQILKEELVQKIILDKNEYRKKYPNQVIVVKARVVGYTDEVGFDETKPLFRELTTRVEDQLPENQPERRKFLNKRLAEFRAKSISDYLKQFILEDGKENSQFKVKTEIVAKGEDTPPGVNVPYPKSDSRRRICKIYNFIIRE